MDNDLIAFIRNEINEFSKSIDLESSIENDLGVTGDDAFEFIMSFSRKYNVDIKEFDFSKYFHSEPNFFTIYKKIEPLTIKDLMNSIIEGKLI